MSWTPKKEEKLKELWKKGYSGSQIANMLGDTTRNAVIGKAHRLKLEARTISKKHRSKNGLVERFEAIVNGKELCNAFSELNDPIDQKLRFEKQVELGKKGDEESMMLDMDYIRALEYGLPPTAGLGIGIDRLVMLFTDSASIRDVLLFPYMRNEKAEN